MKKTLTIFLCLVISSLASGQIKKGQLLFGGSGAFHNTEQVHIESSSLTISPNVGYFFIDKLAGGLKLNVNFSRKEFSGTKISSRGLNVSPFVRYYILPTSGKVNLLAEASYGWGKSREKSPDITNYSTFNSYSFSAGPVIFITPNIAFELTAGYVSNRHRSKISYDNSISKSKEKLFQIGVGFQIHLGGNKKK